MRMCSKVSLTAAQFANMPVGSVIDADTTRRGAKSLGAQRPLSKLLFAKQSFSAQKTEYSLSLSNRLQKTVADVSDGH